MIRIFAIASFLVSLAVIIIAQNDAGTTPGDDPPSVIKGPLVTITEESFVDTVLVRLQSLFYNNNRFLLPTYRETATVLGVDLVIILDGELSVVQDMVESRIVTGSGNVVEFDIRVKNLLLEKRYSITSVQDPLYLSNGSVIVSVEGPLFRTGISTTENPYFVDNVFLAEWGIMKTTVIGEGIPLAEEIQTILEQKVTIEYSTQDYQKYFGEVYNKLTQIFKNNEIILCRECSNLEISD